MTVKETLWPGFTFWLSGRAVSTTGPVPRGSTDRVPGPLSTAPPEFEMRTDYAPTSPACAEPIEWVAPVAPGITTPFFSH